MRLDCSKRSAPGQNDTASCFASFINLSSHHTQTVQIVSCAMFYCCWHWKSATTLVAHLSGWRVPMTCTVFVRIQSYIPVSKQKTNKCPNIFARHQIGERIFIFVEMKHSRAGLQARERLSKQNKRFFSFSQCVCVLCLLWTIEPVGFVSNFYLLSSTKARRTGFGENALYFVRWEMLPSKTTEIPPVPIMFGLWPPLQRTTTESASCQICCDPRVVLPANQKQNLTVGSLLFHQMLISSTLCTPSNQVPGSSGQKQNQIGGQKVTKCFHFLLNSCRN